MGTFSGPRRKPTRPGEIDRTTGTTYGTRRVATGSTQRSGSTATRVPTTDPRINDVGGQYSFNALSNAIAKADLPKSQGGWVDDLLWNNQNGAPPPAAAPPPGGGYPRGGGGGGGSGGGMAVDPTVANFGGYAAAIQQLLQGMQPGPDTLAPKINQAVDADLAHLRQTMGGVADRSADPYAGLRFIAGQFDPGVSGVDGLDPNAALQQQAAGQSDQDYAAQVYQNHAGMMSADQQASNAGWNANKASDTAAMEAQMGAQRSALLAAADAAQKKREDDFKLQQMQALMQLLTSGWQAGADVSGINLGGV